MQVAAPSDSSSDVWSVGPISSTRSRRETSRTQRRNGGEWAGSRKSLLSTSTYSLLIYSIWAPPSVKEWKTFSIEGHFQQWRSSAGNSTNCLHAGVKGIYTWLPVGGSHSTLVLVRHTSAKKKTYFWHFIACQPPAWNHEGATEESRVPTTSRRTRAAHSEKVSATAKGGILLTKKIQIKRNYGKQHAIIRSVKIRKSLTFLFILSFWVSFNEHC